MEQTIVSTLMSRRWPLALLSLLLVLLFTAGLSRLYFESDYRTFFDPDDPHRVANEAVQDTYTDNVATLMLIHHPQGLFTVPVFQALHRLTEQAWSAPFAIRVDSIANYPHSYAEDDELIVEQIVEDPDALDAGAMIRIREIVMNDVQLRDRVVSSDGDTTLLAISHDLPQVDLQADAETQGKQRLLRDSSYTDVVGFAEQLAEQLKSEDPQFEVHLAGMPVINNTFNVVAMRDGSTLMPLMYVIVGLTLGLFLRSVGSVFAALAVTFLATAGAMGWAGWMGIPVTQITVSAPVIILTIAVCDSVHLQVIYLRYLSRGKSPLEAMTESIRVNLQPIILTSVTTTIGFLTLNFSDSPNFRALGNIAAIGVMLAMLLSLLLLPTMQLLLVKRSSGDAAGLASGRLAEFVIRNSRVLLPATLLVALGLIALIPLNTVDDDPIKYFDPGIPFRDAADFSQQQLKGIKNLDFSVSCKKVNCIHDPAYQTMLAEFLSWLSAQPGVEFARSYIDVVKRLNSNMHGDDPAWYRLPENRQMAAQYHLLYEMSLPEGLDMNNQVSFDQSSTLVSMWTGQINTNDFIDIEARAADWFSENYPQHLARGASVDMMFASLGQRTVKGMAIGAVFAVIGVTLTILIALRSVKYGLLSLLPNAFPAAVALGLWGILVGEVNMAVSMVFSVTLGLVVDNTVHFISKYRRAMAGGGEAAAGNSEDAIRYAFSTVGPALLVTTGVLTTGFGLLMLSDFNVNAYMGGLTALTILVAMVFDFLMLPALLHRVDARNRVLG